jgi:hypothetical protein
LVGCACAGCARTLSPLSAVLAVAARLPREMPFPAPVPGSVVGCAYAGSASSCAAAISCPCCGGWPSKGNAVTSACDYLLGRLCLRWLRSHSCRRHCCGGAPARLPSPPVRVTGVLVGCARAGCACTRVAAISCSCCGGSPSKGNAVTIACDCLLGRLCSCWLRLHSLRCHQLSLLWRLTFRGQCCH